MPHLDPSNGILSSVFHIQLAMTMIVDLWSGFGATGLAEAMDVKDLSSCLTSIPRRDRFLILPVYSQTNAALIIIDWVRKEWAYLNPDNEAARNRSLFMGLEALIKQYYPDFASIKGLVIMTSARFHKNLPWIHLLMALYYIAKLFRVSVRLPIRVNYTEKAFRGYCWELCYSLQRANLRHNLSNNLIEESGDLKEGAVYSYPCQLAYDRSVVPTDQCAFCGKRGFNNLGRHLYMAHGGQSADANIARHF